MTRIPKMNLRKFLLSFFLIATIGFALVHAEEAKKEPRGPKITNKVCLFLCGNADIDKDERVY